MRDVAVPRVRAVPRTAAGCSDGTFDDPNWFTRDSAKTKHIFTRSARTDVVLPAGVQIFIDHAYQLDGSPNTPVVLSEPQVGRPG